MQWVKIIITALGVFALLQLTVAFLFGIFSYSLQSIPGVEFKSDGNVFNIMYTGGNIGELAYTVEYFKSLARLFPDMLLLTTYKAITVVDCDGLSNSGRNIEGKKGSRSCHAALREGEGEAMATRGSL